MPVQLKKIRILEKLGCHQFIKKKRHLGLFSFRIAILNGHYRKWLEEDIGKINLGNLVAIFRCRAMACNYFKSRSHQRIKCIQGQLKTFFFAREVPRISPLFTTILNLLETGYQKYEGNRYVSQTEMRFCCFGSASTFIVANVRKMPNRMG